MTVIRTSIFCIGFLLMGWNVRAQFILKKAEAQFRLNNYSLAEPYYEKAFNKKTTIKAARGVAECHRKMNNYVFAESWYAKVVAMPEANNEDLITYAEILINNYKYKDAKDFLISKRRNFQYDSLSAHVSSALITDCDSSIAWLKLPVTAHWDNMAAVNSAQSDWGPVLSNGQLVFASDRNDTAITRKHKSFAATRKDINPRIYGWTGNPYLDLYQAGNNGQATPSTYELQSDANEYHTGNACFSNDGKEIYFTQTNITRRKALRLFRKNNISTIHVELFSAKWDEQLGKWGPAIPFAYNNALEYSVGDPFLSSDGKTLYFVSDMPGTTGGTDIMYCRRDDSGHWSRPVTMGSQINTPGNERTPFFSASGTFYFSSDGRIGMGGLDMYKALRHGDVWQVENMHPPVNSPQDDLGAYFIDEHNGYLSSDRFGGTGSDDIYKVNIAKSEPVYNRKDIVLDVLVKDETGRPLDNAVVTVYKYATGTRLDGITKPEGLTAFLISDTISKVRVAIARTGYLTIAKDLDLSSLPTSPGQADKTKTLEVELQPLEIGKPVELKNIYYDYDKSDLRADAIPDVEKLLKIMQDNPTFIIELGSHTDSRANDTYNMKLSQRRAESVVNYLVKHGIDKKRLIAHGYGETRLVNRCANGVTCTEEEHQANRRTEFTILSK